MATLTALQAKYLDLIEAPLPLDQDYQDERNRFFLLIQKYHFFVEALKKKKTTKIGNLFGTFASRFLTKDTKFVANYAATHLNATFKEDKLANHAADICPLIRTLVKENISVFLPQIKDVVGIENVDEAIDWATHELASMTVVMAQFEFDRNKSVLDSKHSLSDYKAHSGFNTKARDIVEEELQKTHLSVVHAQRRLSVSEGKLAALRAEGTKATIAYVEEVSKKLRENLDEAAISRLLAIIDPVVRRKELHKLASEIDPELIKSVGVILEIDSEEEILDWIVKKILEIPKVPIHPNPAGLHYKKGGLWDDQSLTHVGKTIWERTYKVGGGDSECFAAASNMATVWGEEAQQNHITVNNRRIAVFASIAAFAGKWAVHAFQRITTTHTYAAALMCSDADLSVLQDIEVQWPAFMIVLPNELLAFTASTGLHHEITRILVASFDDHATIILLNQGEPKADGTVGPRIIAQTSRSLATLLDTENVDLAHTTEERPSDEVDQFARITVLAKRLVTGLLLALQYQDNFKSRSVSGKKSLRGKEHDEPGHRIVFVGKPLKIDCRPAVKDYISNGSPRRKTAPPSVQSVVRGHFKRQVIGIGRLGRKVIWIEPYFRGDENAPILTRPKLVVGDLNDKRRKGS